MQKIFIDRSESAADVVERVLQNPDREITVVIPRNAVIASDGENLSLLKREAAAQGKEVSIESVDEVVLALARANGVTAVHPLFAKSGGKTLSDIVPVAGVSRADFSNAKSTVKRAPSKKSKAVSTKSKSADPDKATRKLTIESDGDEEEAAGNDESEDISLSVVAGTRPEETKRADESDVRYAPETLAMLREGAVRSPWKRRIWIGVLGVIVIGALGAWVAGAAFSKVTISLEFKKTPWEYNGPLTVDKADTQIDTAHVTLPGEVFKEDRNLTSLFPASGRVSTSEKATGKITIYNAFATASQQLVANTRFRTPDGKIFHLVRSVTVPGGTMSGGKLQPGKIDADMFADEAGPAYNLGPIAKLTIPGFQGTPKYDGFYGVIVTPTAGGVTGEHAVATAADIAAAQTRAREMIQASLNGAVLRNQPAGFNVVDGASIIAITKVTVVSSTAELDKFGVFGEGNITAIAFRDSDAQALVRALAEASSSGMSLVDITLTYSSSTPHFDKGVLTTTLRASGTLTGTVNQDDLKRSLVGKTAAEAQQVLLDIPNLSHAKIGIWPFWVNKIPSKMGRIVIQVD